MNPVLAVWLEQELGKLDLEGRDDLYTHLLTQETSFWVRDILEGKAVETSDVDFLVRRRGFNTEEEAKFRALATWINDHQDKIRELGSSSTSSDRKKTMPNVQFTSEEEALLTPFDAVAADLMRIRSAEKEQISPAWLCCSAESRTQARKEALEFLRKDMSRPDLTLEEAEKTVADMLTDGIVEHWRAMELTLKKARAEGNPRAFFTG